MSSSSKKQAKKVVYPFGSQTHIAFSDFHFISDPQTKQFALMLADKGVTIKPEIRSEDYDAKKLEEVNAKFRAKLSKLYGKDDSKNSGNPPCTEKLCQEIMKAIIHTKARFKLENVEIQSNFEKLSLELGINENKIDHSDSKIEMLLNEGNSLDETLKQLKLDLEKSKEKYTQLQEEKESFTAKIIQTEYKLQGLIRQHQDAEETLKKTLWGESSRKNSNSSDRHKFHDEYLSRLKIKHAKTTTVNKQTSTYSTSYNSLARDDIIDRTEKMTNIPTLPSYIENNLYLPSVSQGHSMSYFKPNSSTVSSMKQASLMLPTASNLISKSKELKKSFQLSSSTLLYPLSPIKRPNNFSSTSIQRGYTPTGKVRETVSGYAQDIYNDKLLQADPSYQISLLDPVFFRESARLASYRNDAVGRVRNILEDNLTGKNGNSRGILLTSKHPTIDLKNGGSTTPQQLLATLSLHN